MLFTTEISVPANTAKAAPVQQLLQLSKGIITRVSVLWPAGTAQLGHLVLLEGGHPVFPSTDNMSITGDASPIEWDDFYDLKRRPHQLRAILWNEDDTYPHQCTIRITVLPRQAVLALAVVDAFQKLISFLVPRPFRPGRE